MDVLDTIVIGSGPAGVAAARALVARGRAVTMIDVGFTANGPATGPVVAVSSPFGRKLVDGSDHPYRPPVDRALAANETALVPSHARGGLSTVWGATMLPYHDDDLVGWPLTHLDLREAYREVATYVPIAATHDGLARRYPFHGPEQPALRSATTTMAALDRLRPRAAQLAERGIEFGGARLAVNSDRPAPTAGCSYCRRCLEGCPFSHIYSSERTLAELLRGREFTYHPRLFVDRLRPTGATVSLECHDVDRGVSVRLRGRRVLVAAGAVGSTTLLQRSELVPRSRTVLDSALAVVPVALLARPADRAEPAHTLSQLFFRLDEAADCVRPSCIQLYAPNPAVADRARGLQPVLSRVVGPFADVALRSMVLAFVYLHSDLSDAIRCDTDAGGTSLSRIPNEATTAATARLVRRWGRAVARSGLVPLSLLRHQAAVGQSFHVGGSLPMRRNPGRGETDLAGRPHGLRQIHVVDASVFPTIPAGPITFSIMANATRIADAVAAEIDREERSCLN